jgi:ribonuclease BN (tRNA processing enzyme)
VPTTALRLSDGDKVFAYSADTEWTDALLPIARGADLFICECYGYAGRYSGHLTWEALKPRIGDLGAKRTMVTHMNPTMLERLDEINAAGVLTAADGLVMEF